MPEDLFMRNRHSCYMLEYHLVVVTKYRRKVLVDDVREELISIVYDLFEYKWNTKVRAVNTDLV